MRWNTLLWNIIIVRLWNRVITNFAQQSKSVLCNRFSTQRDLTAEIFMAAYAYCSASLRTSASTLECLYVFQMNAFYMIGADSIFVLARALQEPYYHEEYPEWANRLATMHTLGKNSKLGFAMRTRKLCWAVSAIRVWVQHAWNDFIFCKSNVLKRVFPTERFMIFFRFLKNAVLGFLLSRELIQAFFVPDIYVDPKGNVFLVRACTLLLLCY